jgi:hypothetical protein
VSSARRADFGPVLSHTVAPGAAAALETRQRSISRLPAVVTGARIVLLRAASRGGFKDVAVMMCLHLHYINYLPTISLIKK